MASDMALDSLSPFQIMTIRFLLASVLMGGISIRNLKGIKKEEVTAGSFYGRSSFYWVLSSDHRTAIYDSVKKMRSSQPQMWLIVPFIAFLICRKKSRIQRYNRSSAGHRGGGTFVPG